jgi:hypothetical protein
MASAMSDPNLPPEISPDDLPSSPPEPEPSTPGTSRRWFLAGGVAVLLGGGAGVLAEVLHESAPTPASPAPAALVTAVDAERVLIAALDAMPAGVRRSGTVVAQIRADHAAHLHALRRLLTTYPRPARRPAHPGFVQPRTLDQLRGVETYAARDAAQRAAALDGAAAALLASIAACEATHAELLR